MISDARKNATKKYRATLKNISIQIKPAEYARITAAAEREGVPLRQFVLKAIDEKIERDSATTAEAPEDISGPTGPTP